MTRAEAVAGMKRLMQNVATAQWEAARDCGLSDAEIAARWERRFLLPPAPWEPPPERQPRAERNG